MPTFKVWDDESGSIESAVDIDAFDEDAAAEKYAENDTDEQWETYGSGRRIGVMDEDGNITKWEVTAEYSPTFYSMQLTRAPAGSSPGPRRCSR